MLNSTSKILAAALLLLAVCIGITRCREKRDPVRETLDRLVQAAEERDSTSVVAYLAQGFQASDGSGRADAEATLRRYFAAYEDLEVKLSDLSIERAPAAARVSFRADLSGAPRKIGGIEGWLPRSSSYRFELRLVPEGNRWKVAWASYSPAEGR